MAAQGTASRTPARRRPRPKREPWYSALSLAERIEPPTGSRTVLFNCLKCGKMRIRGENRLAQHLLHEPNAKGYSEIAACVAMTTDSIAEAKDSYEDGLAAPAFYARSPGQRTLDDSLGRVIPIGSAQHALVTQTILKFLVDTATPFAVTEDPSFRKIFDVAGISYRMPHRTTFARSALTDLYNETKAHVEEVLLVQGYLQLCSNGWSNLRRESINAYCILGQGQGFLLDAVDMSKEQAKDSATLFADFERTLASIPDAVRPKVTLFISETEP